MGSIHCQCNQIWHRKGGHVSSARWSSVNRIAAYGSCRAWLTLQHQSQRHISCRLYRNVRASGVAMGDTGGSEGSMPGTLPVAVDRRKLWMAAIKPPMYSVGVIPVLVRPVPDTQHAFRWATVPPCNGTPFPAPQLIRGLVHACLCACTAKHVDTACIPHIHKCICMYMVCTSTNRWYIDFPSRGHAPYSEPCFDERRLGQLLPSSRVKRCCGHGVGV